MRNTTPTNTSNTIETAGDTYARLLRCKHRVTEEVAITISDGQYIWCTVRVWTDGSIQTEIHTCIDCINKLTNFTGEYTQHKTMAAARKHQKQLIARAIAIWEEHNNVTI